VIGGGGEQIPPMQTFVESQQSSRVLQGSSMLEHTLAGGGTHCRTGTPLASVPFGDNIRRNNQRRTRTLPFRVGTARGLKGAHVGGLGLLPRQVEGGMARSRLAASAWFKSIAATHSFLRGLGPALLPHGSIAGRRRAACDPRPGAQVLP